MKTVEQIMEAGFAKFTEANEKSLGLYDEKIAAVKADHEAAIADLEKRGDEWLKEIRKEFRQGGAYRRDGQTSDSIVELLTDRQKAMIPVAEAICRSQGAKITAEGQVKFGLDGSRTMNNRPFYDDPILKVASGAWWQGHMRKISNPGDFHGDVRERHAALTKALNGGHEKVALNEAATEGLEFVPTMVEAEIIRLVVDNSEMRPLVRVVPMTTATHLWPRRKAAFGAILVDEEGTVTDQIPAAPFENKTLAAKKFMAFGTVSEELLQDNIVGLVDYITLEFAEQFGLLEDTQALEGIGTGVNFLGLAADTDVNEIDPGGTNGDPLSITDLIAMKYTAKQKSSRNGARYFINTTMWGKIVASRAAAFATNDAEGGLLFANGLQAGIQNSILGSPVSDHSGILENRVKAASGTTLTNLYFGPPQKIVFGDRLGMKVDLNPWSKFTTAQVDIRAMKRTGILTTEPTAFTRLINISAVTAVAA